MKIIINKKTPTVNHLYGRSSFGTIFMKKEAKELREVIIEETMKQITKQGYIQPEWSERLLKMKVTIYEDWFTKKHTIKKKDVANREKFLTDSIFIALRLDDSQIWENILIKKDADDPVDFKAEIELDFYKQ